jgi:hypothetical protein
VPPALAGGSTFMFDAQVTGGARPPRDPAAAGPGRRGAARTSLPHPALFAAHSVPLSYLAPLLFTHSVPVCTYTLIQAGLSLRPPELL